MASVSLITVPPKPVTRAVTLEHLTPMETIILQRLASGVDVKAIARELERSHKTIEAHKYNLMLKLDIHKTVDLVHLALAAGLVANKFSGYLDEIPCPS